MDSTFDSDDFAILADILARINATWLPPRKYNTGDAALDNRTIVAILERRRAAKARGVPYVARGSSQQAKATERRLNAMQAAGFLVIRSRGRVREVRLTDRGDDWARFVTAEPMVSEAWPWLSQIEALQAAGISAGPIVRETDLARVAYGSPERRRLIDLEYVLLPLKAAGLVDDATDVAGRVFYSLTPHGRRAVAGPPRRPAPDLPPYPGSTWCDLHDELLRQYEAERLDWRPDSTGEVYIPLPVSGPPYATWRDVKGDLPPLPST